MDGTAVDGIGQPHLPVVRALAETMLQSAGLEVLPEDAESPACLHITLMPSWLPDAPEHSGPEAFCARIDGTFLFSLANRTLLSHEFHGGSNTPVADFAANYYHALAKSDFITSLAEAISSIWQIPPAGIISACSNHDDRSVRYFASVALQNAKPPWATPALIRAFKDRESDVAHAFYKALDQPTGSRPIEALIAAFRDRFLRDWAKRALLDSGPRAIPGLVAALDSPDSDLRVWAVTILTEMAAPAAPGSSKSVEAFEALIAALKHPNWEVRKASATALGDIGDLRATEPLIAALSDEEPGVPVEAARALAKLKDPRSAQSLILALQSRSSEVVISAATTLAGFLPPDEAEPLLPLLRHPGLDVRKAAVSALEEIGAPSAIAPLLSETGTGSPIAYESAWALQTIAKRVGPNGGQAMDPLIAAAGDRRFRRRDVAITALGMARDPRAVEPLIAALNDMNEEIRHAAGKALGEIGDPRAVEPLVSAIRTGIDREPYIISAYVEALGRIGPPAADPLIALLSDSGPRIRREDVLEALGTTGDARAVGPLVGALQDESWRVRFFAVRALEKLGASSPQAPLVAALKDPQLEVREAAARALGTLGDPSAIPPLIQALCDRSWWVRTQAAGSLEKLAGYDLPPDPAAWQKWWNQTGKALERP